MNLKKQSGQALIELIIFLPLMFMFYSMISGFANAINGSINQQKITRAYFYYRVQNNSMVPKPGGDQTFLRWKLFGSYFIGWKDYFSGGASNSMPVAACYKLTTPLGSSNSDKCELKYTNPSTMFVRVQTVYGVCGATFATIGTEAVQVPDFLGGDYKVLTGRQGCLLQ